MLAPSTGGDDDQHFVLRERCSDNDILDLFRIDAGAVVALKAP